MSEVSFGPSVPRTLWSVAVALVLIAVLVPVRAFAYEPSPPIEGQSQTAQDHCRLLMEKTARELRGLARPWKGGAGSNEKSSKRSPPASRRSVKSWSGPGKRAVPASTAAEAPSATKRHWQDAPRCAV